VLEVIGGERAELGSEPRAVHVRELVRVHLHRQPLQASGAEDAFRLCAGEGDRLAERIDRVRQSLSRNRRNGFTAHVVDVIVGAPRVLGRERMGGEQRRAHVHPRLRTQASRDAQLLGLRGRIEAIARLDLDRGDAFGCKRSKARHALLREVGLARGARCTHGRCNAAALARDVGVGGAVEAALELVRAIAGVNEMRVAIDETRQQPIAGARQDRRCLDVGSKVAARPDPCDAIARHADRGVADRAVPSLHRGDVGVDDQKVETVHAESRANVSR